MERIIIYGIGDLAFQLYRYLSLDNRYKVDAFSVEKEYLKEKEFLGLPVVAFETIETIYAKDDYKMLVCVGYNSMNQTRARIFSAIIKKGYEIINYIHPLATVLSEDIGFGNIILENANISIGAKIGNGNIIYNNVTVCHDVHIKDFNFFAPSSCVLGFCQIDKYCFIGANATIRNNVSISKGCLIGANSFIRDNTKNYSVYVPEKTRILNKSSIDIEI